jgi:hypothetical protein
MLFPRLSAEQAGEALAALGVIEPADQIRVEWRTDRWAVHLPGQRLAWFAATERARVRLSKERRVLRLLEARCSFQAPRVVAESASGDYDLRTMVAGLVDPWPVYDRVRHDPALARRLGAGVGAILAEQHTRISEQDVAGWLPRQPDWPESRAWIRERLPQVIDDAPLMADIEAVMAGYEAVTVGEPDRALIHQDVGFHNLALDPWSLEVRGLFDYESASWSDRHHDFRYLLFDFDRPEMLDSARAIYEPLVGRPILPERDAVQRGQRHHLLGLPGRHPTPRSILRPHPGPGSGMDPPGCRTDRAPTHQVAKT